MQHYGIVLFHICREVGMQHNGIVLFHICREVGWYCFVSYMQGGWNATL